MTVIWDGRVLCGPEIRGMGSYTVNVLRSMRTLRPGLDVRLAVDEPLPDPARAQGFPVAVVGPARGYRWQLWERAGLPWYAMRAGADLVHSPANTTPGRSRVPRIVTVHDVIPYLPHAAGAPLTDPYWLHRLPAAIRSAAAVLTCSESSRDDIVRVLGVDSGRITVVPYTVAGDIAAPDKADVAAMLDEHGIRGPYLLALAATAPRKNTRGVLQVFAQVARQRAEVQLVLTGVGARLRPGLEALVADLGIAPARVRLLDFVEPRVRNALYAGAAVFLFLSLYEGFGLPILEAMKCGAPVVCSNRSSCPEVAGDAAIIVDPEDHEAAAAAIAALLAAPETERQAWIARGRRREAAFSWTRTAEMTLDVYDRIAG